MAERRMFAKTIIDSDAFLDMPLSTQALYFHLSMRADDEGFINNPKKIMRMIGAGMDEMKVLIAKKFVLEFESGVVVIKHWKIHNYIRKDRMVHTVYQEERQLLNEKESGAYTFKKLENQYFLPAETIDNDDEIVMSDTCQPDVNQVSGECQHRLGKDRLGKVSIGKVRVGKVNISTKVDCSNKLQPKQRIINSWNALGLSQLRDIKGNRLKLLNTRIREYSLKDVLQAIDNINNSSFCKGQNDRGWIITFDWFVKPNNFPKVLEGNYNDKGVSTSGGDKPSYDKSKFLAPGVEREGENTTGNDNNFI